MQRGRFLNLTALAGALSLAVGAAPAALAQTTGATTPTTPTTPAAGALPAGWMNQDIAATKPKTPGSTTYDSATGVWTVTGTGGDVWDKADAGFQFAYTMLPGDGGITAHLLTQVGGADTDWSKTGTMLRESTDPSAADAFLSYASATGGKDPQTFQPSWRANTGGKVAPGSSNPSDSYGTDAVEPIPGTHRLDKGPIWLRTQRQGKTYQHLVSNDGKNWLLLGSETVNIDPGKPILAGIWASQGGSKTPNVVTYDNVGTSTDIVQPAASTVVPAPTNIQAVPGNGAVLLTFAPAPGAAGTNVYRQTQGGKDKPVLVNAQPTANGWVIDTGVTNGTTYLYTLKSVTDLTKVGGTMAESVVPGAQVIVAPQMPIGSGFTIQYAGVITPSTLAVDNSGVLTITASGSHLWDTSAEGTFLAMPVSGDYSMNAKVLAAPVRQSGLAANSDTKVGPMIRTAAGVMPNDAYAWVFTTVGRSDKSGLLFEGRPLGAGSKAYSDVGAKEADVKYPIWLKLSKQGAVISAYQSGDGSNFTQVGTSHDYGILPTITYAGIGLTSGSATKTMTAMLDASSIQVGPPYTPPAPAAPAAAAGTTTGTTTAGTTGATTTTGTTTAGTTAATTTGGTTGATTAASTTGGTTTGGTTTGTTTGATTTGGTTTSGTGTGSTP